ncbi:ABC transporter substrate-binding protein [Candidimonas humi]|uniref:ABC transporter substrate-binding protein n=1 Tax=Candidimonas humi TaxID=683355 RepID=A0ABV8P437_9BURK|nr:ABC transporter substrate-binding protein [Candidimonas humi]MBV6307340.1 ABC transporter substrate-binding protein [Candidimonas humi]
MNSKLEDIARDLAPHGVLRAAINFGNTVLAQRHPDSGEPAGISADLARELARRLGRDIEFVTFDAAGKVFAVADQDTWDVAFLAIDPVRAEKVQFTAPYVIIEGTYMVRSDSPFAQVGDVDREGVRVAVGKGAAYDLYLSRSLQHAELVRAPTSADAIDYFVDQSLDAAAGVRQPLEAYAATHAGLRVMRDRFTAIEQAMGTPKGRTVGLEYLQSFIKEMKASGFVADALKRSGQLAATVAP